MEFGRILIGIIILLIAIRYYSRVRGSWLHYYERKLLNRPLTKRQKAILLAHHEFYNLLPARSRKKFEHRLALFIQVKKFIPREIESVTEEMKVLIGATAIQLTFGLPFMSLRHFKYIIVYPDAYYSQITQQYHQGEVNPRQRAIVLSWKSFLEGNIKKEGKNLGLHELAHALHLENVIRNNEYNFFDRQDLELWEKLAAKEMTAIKSGTSSFFRIYGSTDDYEFFAVAIENFFERPKEFDAHHPKLYDALSLLLRQNPLSLQS